MRTSRLLLILVAVVSMCWPQKNMASTPADTAALVIADSLNARSLIISEIMMANRDQESWVYAEFANTGSTDLDLSHYFSWSTWHNNVWASSGEMSPSSGRRITLSGTLAPGDVYLVVRREHNTQEDPWGNLIYPNGYTNLEAEALADTIRTRQNPVEDEATYGPRSVWCEWRIGLCYINQITEFDGKVWPDSVFIDRFGPARDDYPDGNADSESADAWLFPIAGLASSGPRRAAVYVRKYGVLKGNTVEGAYNDYPTIEWDQSRGTDLDDSEWIPLPRSMDSGYDKIFTTLGYHGPTPEFSITSTKASIDDGNKVITLPYGTSRDSVFRLFETGLNHAWELKLGADTGQFFVQEDDSLFFYTAGEQRNLYKYSVKLDGAPAASALVAPLVYKNDNEAFVRNFDISNGMQPMDTIGTLPYDLPMDTLFAYTVKEEGATWEIIPADGQKRPEIKEGDILKVTSADKSTTKEYYLGVQEFFPNHNANLSTVILSGVEIFENPETYMLTDTLLGFSQATTLYSVKLPSEYTKCPAIIAPPATGRSTVVVKRAEDLKGSEEARTATIIVTAEDDTTIKEYKVIFSVEREEPAVQGSLFVSDVATNWGANNAYNVQIFNPSDELVDLTDYVLINMSGPTGWGDITSAYANDSNWQNNNKRIFRFGSVVEPAEDGTPVFKTDLLQNTILLDRQDVYSMASRTAYPITYAGTSENDRALADKYIDLIWGSKALQSTWASTKGWLLYGPMRFGSADPYNSGHLLFNGFNPNLSWSKQGWASIRFGIAKIINDSIKDGTKHVFESADNFANDYEWVDVFGGVSYDMQSAKMFDNDEIVSFTENISGKNGVYRKPSIYRGNPVDGASFGLGDTETKETYIPSEWVNYGWDPATGSAITRNDEGTGLLDVRDARFGSHVMITYSHISYLTSAVYLMEEGLVGPQEITGVLSGTTVDQFLNNVDKADTGMVVMVYGAGDVEISGDDPIVAGTKVWSWSASGNDSVNYVINALGALDNNCTLTSDDYTVTTTAPTGTVSGIKIGTTLETILLNVSAPETAVLNITDGASGNVAIYKYDGDTIKQQTMLKVPALASTMTYIEVIAQDKVTKNVYALEFEEETTPFILSDVYVVDEVNKVIDFVGRTSPTRFLSNLVASTGATLKVVNKYDQERTLGLMEYSDRVIVTKGDVSVSYWLKFTINEEIIGVDVDKVVNKGLSIYPNPTTDFVQLRGVSGKFVEVRDLTGKVITKQTISSTEPMIDMRSMSTGVYIISTKDASYKVIKE